MRSGNTLLVAVLAVPSLASCNEPEQSFEPSMAESRQPGNEEGQALEALIAKPVRRDQAFFANPDFSEKQADYLMARLAELPEVDRECVETDLSDSFDERMAACEASKQWTFLCGGCNRISDSIMYDPAAMVSAMQLCGVEVDLPNWE